MLDEHNPDLLERAELELRAEEEREEVDRIKIKLRQRSDRMSRFVTFWALIKLAFKELLA